MTAAPTPAAADRLLTEREVADRLRISTRTLRRWASTDVGPPRSRLAGTATTVRYSAAALEAYLAQQLPTSTDGVA